MVNEFNFDRTAAAAVNAFSAERAPKILFNGEEPVTLTHTSAAQDKPHFVQAVLLPGRGMNTFQIRAFVPGTGFVDVLATPPLPEAAKELGQDDPYGNLSFKHGGALLIPFANRIRGPLSADKKFVRTRIGTKELNLPANWKGQNPGAEPHAMHGLILHTKAEVQKLSHSKDEASVEARIKAGDFGVGWPSSTDLTFRTTLKDQTISVHVEAKNVGSETLPIGMGWHPYFNLPSGDRKQARLTIPASKRALVNNYDDVFPTGQVEDVKGTPYDYSGSGRVLGSQFLDDCFFNLEHDRNAGIVAEIADPAARYGLRVRARSPQFKAFQVYAPIDQSFVALEPQFNLGDPYGKEWNGRVDTGMVNLAPGESVTYAVDLELFTPAPSTK